MYQTQQSPIPNRNWYPFNTMNRSFMMDKKASFEEKYWVYNNQQQWTQIEATPEISMEDLVVPPSLEENPNQSSPLPPDVANASDQDALDEYIRKAWEISNNNTEEEKSNEVWSIDIQMITNELQQLSIKDLKDEYVNRWGNRDVSHNNNKKNLIDLIIELVINGTPQEETTDWATAWQDGSVD